MFGSIPITSDDLRLKIECTFKKKKLFVTAIMRMENDDFGVMEKAGD